MKHPELHHILVENTPETCKIKTIYCPYDTGKYPAYEAFSSCDECNHEDIAALAAAAEDGEDEIEAHGVKHIRLPWEWEWLSPQVSATSAPMTMKSMRFCPTVVTP